MSSTQARIFSKTRSFSTLALIVVVALSLVFSQFIDRSDITWQVVVALIALAAGIPHGALDHLVALPRASFIKMALFILLYVAIAITAVWAILSWNVLGFIGVVVMSALHFGIGDTAFISELDRLESRTKASRLSQSLYALSAGTLPVLIPLTNDKSTEALAAVNSELISWHGGYDRQILVAVLICTGVAALTIAREKRWRDLLDLTTLAALALLTPPLVAFAAYFGLWHALRHTARLTLNLKRSQRAVSDGDAGKAFRQAVIPGLPALVGTFLVSLLIAWQTSGDISDRYLWLSLVVVWALTVPHMMVTVKLDRAALG